MPAAPSAATSTAAALDLSHSLQSVPPHGEVPIDNPVGTIERHQGKLDASAKALREAMRRADRVLKPDRPERINPRVGLARTETDRHRYDEALCLAEASLTLLQQQGRPGPDEARRVVRDRRGPVGKSRERDRALEFADKASASW